MLIKRQFLFTVTLISYELVIEDRCGNKWWIVTIILKYSNTG